MDRRGFLKRAIGAGATAAIAPILPGGSDLIRLECKGCGGVLKPVGDFFECENCGARYALGGVVMQEDEEPQRVMESFHCVCDSTGEPIWTAGATKISTYEVYWDELSYLSKVVIPQMGETFKATPLEFEEWLKRDV